MEAFGITRYGDNQQLKSLTVATPGIKPNEVLIQVKAASVNPIDFKIRSGKLKLIRPFKFPLVLGHDCAGIVTEVGAAVTQWQKGDAVYTRIPNTHLGTFAEFVAVPAEAVALKPKNVSFAQAASIPLAGLTAYQALFDVAGLQKNQKVFIPAGSGGVGSFAIQLAKHKGAYVATTTSTKNKDWVKNLGADCVIDYRQEDFSQQLSGFDVVFDTLGGQEQQKAFTILKPGGHLVSIVGPFTAATARSLGMNPLLQMIGWGLGWRVMREAKRHGVDYTFMLMKTSGKQLSEMAGLVEQGIVKPIVDRVFPFHETREAVAYVEAGHARGKVVIEL